MRPSRNTLLGIPIVIDITITQREIRMNPETLMELHSIGTKNATEVVVSKFKESGEI